MLPDMYLGRKRDRSARLFRLASYLLRPNAYNWFPIAWVAALFPHGQKSRVTIGMIGFTGIRFHISGDIVGVLVIRLTSGKPRGEDGDGEGVAIQT